MLELERSWELASALELERSWELELELELEHSSALESERQAVAVARMAVAVVAVAEMAVAVVVVVRWLQSCIYALCRGSLRRLDCFRSSGCLRRHSERSPSQGPALQTCLRS